VALIDFTELLSIPTPKRYLKLLIPNELESELLFVMEHVMLGKQKRFQQWISKKHMTGAENDDFIVDMIRYICGVFHPSNALLQSDMVPRWAMVGWLLKCLKVSSRTKESPTYIDFGLYILMGLTRQIMGLQMRNWLCFTTGCFGMKKRIQL
jgi:hypothetical protein